MKFRETIKEDLDYMADNSINHSVDRKQMDCVDYVYTLEHNEIPLAVGGFRMIVPTTAWCWIDLSHESGKHIHTVYRQIRDWIDKFTESHDVKRLQAFIRVDYEEAIRMVEHLGFKKESTMYGFFGDKDGYMYTRRPNGHER